MERMCERVNRNPGVSNGRVFVHEQEQEHEQEQDYEKQEDGEVAAYSIIFLPGDVAPSFLS